VSEKLRAQPDELSEKISALLEQLDAREKEITRLRRELARGVGASAQNVRNVRGVNVVSQVIDAANMDLLREQIDFLRGKVGSGVFAVGSVIGDKPNMVVAVTPDWVAQGLNAKDIVGAAAKVMDGGGGGKPTLAQAGGRDPTKLQDALDFVSTFVEEKRNGK
jgi:alanyl-tRNA synthetase